MKALASLESCPKVAVSVVVQWRMGQMKSADLGARSLLTLSMLAIISAAQGHTSYMYLTSSIVCGPWKHE